MTNHRKWISIEDRLPEEKETVIAATDRGYVYVAFLDYDHEWHTLDGDDWFVAKKVTHWMELPPAPGPTMTNADRIRAMTDEELACFLDQVQVDAFLFGQGLKDKLGREEDSASAWFDWLKQEAEQ